MGLKVSPGALHPRRIVMRSTGAGRRIVIRPSASGGSGGGVTDHGALTGLGDDDHPQYALADGTRGAFATTAQGDLADTAVQPSALSDAITAHTAATDPHGDRAYTDAQIIASLANFVAGAPGILDTWLEMVTAIQADQTGLAALTTVVAGKLAKASNLSDLADIPTARTNLGLGSAATTAASAYDAAGTAAAAQAAAIAAAATDATTKADAKVADAINDGTTTVAPSQNAVFDALALKVPTSRTIAGLDLSADPTASALRTALGQTWQQIADTTLGSAAASMSATITGYRAIRFRFQGRSERTGSANDGLRARFNSDSGSNYSTQAAAATSLDLGLIASSLTNTDRISQSTGELTLGSSSYTMGHSISSHINSTATVPSAASTASQMWNGSVSNAPTSFSIYTNSGSNLAAGSRLIVEGIV
jgi:hypothetical protein